MPVVGVIGLGSIGTIQANAHHQLGHNVLVNDTSPDAIRNSTHQVASKRRIARDADYILITVPTPTNATGGDPSVVNHVLDALPNPNGTIVIRSTMPPGTTRQLAARHDLPLVYSPEFLRDRATTQDFFHRNRLVLAGPKDERRNARDFLTHPEVTYDHIIETRDYLPAELGKEAHNAFFATKVSFANQIRAISEHQGIDPSVVMDIVTADDRTHDSHLDPTLGPYGGKCLPKDTEALRQYARVRGVETPLLDGTVGMNQVAREVWRDVEIRGEWPDIEATGD